MRLLTFPRIVLATAILLLASCADQSKPTVAKGVFDSPVDPSSDAAAIDLADIQSVGELIVLTLYGPTSYYEFRGEDFGYQYKLAEVYARSIGVTIRVDVCRNKEEMVNKLERGDGDIIAYDLTVADSLDGQLTFCGMQAITHFADTLAQMDRSLQRKERDEVAWAVRASSADLASSLDHWLTQHQDDLLALSQPHVSSGTKGRRPYIPRRKTSSPILNVAKGQISFYDDLFKRYSRQCGWDWRLVAAQAYQESAFDPEAVSWMGAMGLMQLMPTTARSVGVSESEVFRAEPNLRGAVTLISQLNTHYRDIAGSDERINFILAAYNAGPGHVDDARRLAEKHGLNPNVWNGHVDQIVLKMSDPEYYNDPAARHGYFRGSETYHYVGEIRNRWNEYRAKIH